MEPADLLGTFCYLLSDDSAFVSGQTMLVDGGRVAALMSSPSTTTSTPRRWPSSCARGDVHPRELVDAAIERAEARNPALNAIIHRQFERARDDAERVDMTRAVRRRAVPAQGLQGSRGRRAVPHGRAHASRARLPAAHRQRVRAAGPRRRADPDRSHQHARAGGDGHHRAGSSTARPTTRGRSVARPAARRVDRPPRSRRGSCRSPTPPTSRARSASRRRCAGVVGLKPTRGRVIVSAGDPPIGMNVEGVVTRSVRDTAALRRPPGVALAVVAGATAAARRSLDEVGADPGRLRIGVWTEAFNGAPVDPDSAAAATDAADAARRRWAITSSTSAPAVLLERRAVGRRQDGDGDRRRRRGRGVGGAHRARARRGRPRAAHVGDGAGRAGDDGARGDGT